MSKEVRVKDPLYGSIKVTSPVLIDLLVSAPVQRLKRINQLGIPDEFYHVKNFSRYDHCVGVMLLLKHLGASEEEQVAGLLHDVSHMAFSHLYDWVVDDYTKPGGTEGRQDEGHVDFIKSSEIPGILTSYGLDIKRVTDYHHFGLLERGSPALCADRVDYSLREIPEDIALKIFYGLIAMDKQIVCRNFETAALFARAFLKLQTDHWGGYEATARYHQFSSILRKALTLKEVDFDDFLVDDEYVMAKLKKSSDLQIQSALELLRQKPLPLVNEGVRVYKKFRYIDPPFVHSDNLLVLSQVDEGFRQLLEDARMQNKRGVLVPAKPL